MLGKTAQENVTNAADAGYENVPCDADRRNNLGEHVCSMTEKRVRGQKNE